MNEDNKLFYTINFPKPYFSAIHYTWQLICHFLNIESEYRSESKFVLGNSPADDVFISRHFCKAIDQLHNLEFDQLLFNENGRVDYVTSIFCLVNSLQEYHSDDKLDKLGRFDAIKSIQFTTFTMEENLVAQYILRVANDSPILTDLSNPKYFKSRIQISHDIDFVKNAFLKDAFYAIRNFDASKLLSIFIHEFFIRPDLTFIPKIMNLHDEYDVKATFFWMVEKGIIEVGRKTFHNADYDIRNKSIQNLISEIQRNSHDIGLHKSLNKKLDFQNELNKLGIATSINRNHFLHFNLPTHYHEVENAGLKNDCSLGYSSHMGFRNSYGLPFQPYNMKENRPFLFTEWPIHIMDSTFQYGHHENFSVIKQRILNFLDKNKKYSIISLLWHNNSFQYFRTTQWLELYKDILDFVSTDFDIQKGYDLE